MPGARSASPTKSERLLLAARDNDVPVFVSRTVDDLKQDDRPIIQHLSRSRQPDSSTRCRTRHRQAQRVPTASSFAQAGRGRGSSFPTRTTTCSPGPSWLHSSTNVMSKCCCSHWPPIGIWETTRHGAAEGFYIVVVEDCVGSARRAARSWITHLRQHFDVVPSEDVVAALEKRRADK